MNLTTKGDLVLAALRKLGVASNATLTDVEPQSMEDGVNDLEMMMAEWLGGDASPGINVGYIFADADVAPDPGDEHGLSNNAINAVIFNLACRIAPDYALEASAKLITTARYGKERLVKLSAMDRAKAAKCKSGYPNRMPVGSGNQLAKWNGWNYFHRKEPCDNGSKAKAVVTKRIRTLKANGKDIDTIGIPIHWGYEGVAKKGFIANTLTPFVGDANTQTPEFKSFLVNVEKV